MNEFGRYSKVYAAILCLTALVAGALFFFYQYHSDPQKLNLEKEGGNIRPTLWQAPDTATIPRNAEGNFIRYGRDLIARTSYYLGPQGIVMKISNGMNCQNCHLEAGTKPFGNNYGSVAATYPKFRPRSAKVESIEMRVNDCFERSLNGKPLDFLSNEMRAVVAYIQWLGKDTPRGASVPGSGLAELTWLDRAADPVMGKELYTQNCRICHGDAGEGLKLSANSYYIYPPMWGENSFNTGAGLYRISAFARYIRTNMPNGATFENPILTEQEAWDIAAFAVSLPRPEKKFVQDWPELALKPIDYPYGPYVDNFTEEQHKYGPFQPILASTKK